tara:strand:- start:2877 stop:3554 length:678 start_codon:yes stop_codon:yes gene_type:complete
MALAKIGERITDLLGSDYNSIPSNSSEDLIRAAVNEVADMLPSELLLKYIHYKTDITSAGMDAIEEKKVLLVTREVADAGLQVRECKAVPYQEFLRAQDNKSLYFATVESPVYSYDIYTATDPKLKIAPEPTANQIGSVWHFNYLGTSDTPSDSTTINGLPDVCLQAVVLKSCMNIIQAYISDFVQDEEDVEMQGMLMNQLQSFQAQFQQEMQRFAEQDAAPRGE